MLKISVHSEDVPCPTPAAMLRGGVRRALGRGGPFREVTVVVVGDPSMARLNRTYHGGRGATDVLAFALDELAEIVVSTDTARREARRRRLAWAQEILRYAVHGALHLAGERDDTPALRRRMWRRQESLVREVWAGRKHPRGGA